MVKRAKGKASGAKGGDAPRPVRRPAKLDIMDIREVVKELRPINPEIRHKKCFQQEQFSSGLIAFRPQKASATKQINHDDKDVVCFVIKGRARLRVRNRRIGLRPGTLCHIPKGTPHDFAAGKNGRAVHARIGGDIVRGRLTDGGDLPLIPPLRLLAALEYDAGPLHAALDVQWFDDQDRTARGETPTEGGTLLGAEVSYRGERWDPGLLVFLRGSNLLDEELRRHTSPLKDYVPLPGASVLLGMRVGF